jgi:uncharacterized membrane protein YgcG
VAGQVYWVYDPGGTAHVNLPGGMHELTIRATDWSHNTADYVICFFVDNALAAPVVPGQNQPGGAGGPGGGFGGGGGGFGGGPARAGG